MDQFAALLDGITYLQDLPGTYVLELNTPVSAELADCVACALGVPDIPRPASGTVTVTGRPGVATVRVILTLAGGDC